MAKPFGNKTHTVNSVVVYVDHDEKKSIKEYAKLSGKSMSKYMLDLHLKNIKDKELLKCL